MCRKVSALLVVAVLLLAMAWPALADTISLTVTPLDPTTAIAIDASNPPPPNLNVLKGSYRGFSVTVKNMTDQSLFLYAKGYDAVPSGGYQPWTLEEVSPTSPPAGSYGVVAKQSYASSYSTVTKSGSKITSVEPNSEFPVNIRIYLPAAVDTADSQQVQVDLYGGV